MKTFDHSEPTIVTFPDLLESEARELRQVLAYKDPKVEQELKRLLPPYARKRYVDRHGADMYNEIVAELKGKLNVTMLREAGGVPSTLAGFTKRLRAMGYDGPSLQQKEDDSPLPMATSYKPPMPRYYQLEAEEALWNARHAAISLPTGSGKSLVVERLVRRHGERAIIMAPSRSIAGQLHSQLVKAFGRGTVGLFGDGKKESKRDVVVGIAASLTKVDGEHARWLRQAKLFIADESHLTPATMFEKVCLDVAAGASDRYFVSATQFRNDGTDILLEGITGPVVYKKSLEGLVNEGFLARPRFMTMEVPSTSSYTSPDWHRMVDKHVYSNTVLAESAAALANKCRSAFNHPVLILIDEVCQFKHLLPHLRHEVGFAHGPLTAENKGDVDERFQKSNVDELVAKFNDGQLPILVGTSCITTGTDLRPTGTIIYLMAGESEIKFMQAVGRGTRLVPGKTSFNIVFFDVTIPGLDGFSNMFHRHFTTLKKYCEPFGTKSLKF